MVDEKKMGADLIVGADHGGADLRVRPSPDGVLTQDYPYKPKSEIPKRTRAPK